MKCLVRFTLVGVVLMLLAVCTSCGHSKRTQAKSTESGEKPTKEAVNQAILEKYSLKLGVPTENLRSEGLYVFIDQWEGVPYKYGGTAISGVDCSGFVNTLYRAVYNKELPRTTGEISSVTKPVLLNQLQEGDLVFFDINGKKTSHVGVYLHNGKFIHASTSKGVIISDLAQQYYRESYAKGGRL